MSELVNTLLLERASEMMEYWTGTPYAELIEFDIARNDLDMLAVHVAQAEAEAAHQEFEAADII